jgi:hypothetical protein
LDLEVSAVQTFMVASAQALQCTEPESSDIAAMVFDVVHDFGDGHNAAFSPA